VTFDTNRPYFSGYSICNWSSSRYIQLLRSVYTAAMGRATAEDHVVQKTTVEVDMTELDAARAILGTVTIRDTINTALHEVTRRQALARAAAAIQRGAFEMIDPDELTTLRRSRIED
jgi:hypothetical protein